MALSIGQVLRGRKGTYRLLEALKGSAVFKAQVLPNSSIKSGLYDTSVSLEYFDCAEIKPSVVVKTEAEPEKPSLERELSNYRLPGIASCQHIRALYDVIGPDEDDTQTDNASTTEDPLCIVLEWMDLDLRSLPADEFRRQLNLPKIVAKSVLSALAVLKTQYNAIHTGE